MTERDHREPGATSGAPLAVPVVGMTCAACSTRLERLLQRRGFAAARVDLATERLTLVDDVSSARLTDAVDVVRDAGFLVPLQEWRVALPPEGKLAAAREALGRLPGVLEAEVAPGEEALVVRAVAGAVTRGSLDVELAALGVGSVTRAGALESPAPRGPAGGRLEGAMLVVAWAGSLPLLGNMALHAAGVHARLPLLAEWALGTMVLCGPGARFFVGAARTLRTGGANMDVLVALGTGAAWLWSTGTVLGLTGGGVWFEASSVVIAFLLLGKALERKARDRATAALRGLSELRPERARRERAGALEEVPVEAIGVGDVVLVPAGERVPADGMLLSDACELDESLLTGEAEALVRRRGDRVVAGSMPVGSAARVHVVAIGRDTTLARILGLVERAQLGRAPAQRLADAVARVFVPVVVALAVATVCGWLLLGASAADALRAAISVLVVACPCALGLATPTALVAGTGAAARAGILVRDIEVLERAHAVRTVVFDKTGTLTDELPSVVECSLDDEALSLAAAAQAGASHPIGNALRALARERGLPLPLPDAVEAVAGQGLRARVHEHVVLVGRPRWVTAELGLADDAGSAAGGAEADPDAARADERTEVAVAVDGALRGRAELEARLRPGAAEAVALLRARGLRVVLLSGDRPEVAARVGRELRVDEALGGVSPERKLAEVERIRRRAGPVAMVGDGVNDAAALAAADVGIAMGSAVAVAAEAAGLTLLRGDPRLVVDALDVSRATFARVRLNLLWAFGYNVACLPLAVLGLLGPVAAGAAMAASSVSVVASSALLSGWRPRRAR